MKKSVAKHRGVVARILSADPSDPRSVDMEYAPPRRPQPVRIFGETESRLLLPRAEQIAQWNRQRLRGRFVHRHKGKAMRQHALRAIRLTYEAETAIHNSWRLNLRPHQINVITDESLVDGALVLGGLKFASGYGKANPESPEG